MWLSSVLEDLFLEFFNIWDPAFALQVMTDVASCTSGVWEDLLCSGASSFVSVWQLLPGWAATVQSVTLGSSDSLEDWAVVLRRRYSRSHPRLLFMILDHQKVIYLEGTYYMLRFEACPPIYMDWSRQACDENLLSACRGSALEIIILWVPVASYRA